MLDTIKLGIPLTSAQHKRIKAIADNCDRWQWVMLNPSTGDLLFRKVSGLATTDGESFHRDLRWDIPHTYESDCRLLLEFSIPKYWYGHNIHLLYDFLEVLNHLKRSLEAQFELKGKAKLPEVGRWYIHRLDICYAWRFPSQLLAQRFLDSLKRLHYPRKRPVIHPTSIFFAGATYSVKFYLKLPEYKSHDRKLLLKQNASIEWVNHCEKLADGVLRYEATLRHKFLKRQGISTVGDLIRPKRHIEWLEGTPPESEWLREFAIAVAVHFHFVPPQIDPLASFFEWFISHESWFDENLASSALDGLELPIPEVNLTRNDAYDEMLRVIHDGEMILEKGKIAFRKEERVNAIAQFLLVKFVGENPAMQQVDEIKTKLLETYKPVKASRLLAFWLYVQKFGSADAKEMFGKNSYYVSRSDLKKAGVSLIEPPKGSNIIPLEQDFLQQFRMKIPSEFVTNKVDDFRDSGNVLNFVPKLSDSDAS